MTTGDVLDSIAADVQQLLAARLYSESDADARAGLAKTRQILAGLEAHYLARVQDLDTRTDAVAGAPAGKVAYTFLLRQNIGRGQAGRDVRAARALDGELHELAKAFEAGEVTRAHVDVAAKTVAEIPSSLREAAPIVDAFLTDRSRLDPPTTVDRLAKELISALDPDGSSRFDPDAGEQRLLEMHYDGHSLTFRGKAFGAQAAALHAAITAGSGFRTVDLVPDTRSLKQRRLDALAGLVENGAAHWEHRERMEPPHVAVVATLDQLAGKPGSGFADVDGQPVPDETLREMMCDAIFQPVILGEAGEILHLGRKQRLASKHQHKALAIRDLGCIIPDCDAPPGWCDAHHVRWWSNGGPTDIENLALLCSRHHTQVHEGIQRLIVIDGMPHALDDQGTPKRNTRHRDLAAARRIGAQLRLDLGA